MLETKVDVEDRLPFSRADHISRFDCMQKYFFLNESNFWEILQKYKKKNVKKSHELLTKYFSHKLYSEYIIICHLFDEILLNKSIFFFIRNFIIFSMSFYFGIT